LYFLLVTIPACSFCNIRGNWNGCFIFCFTRAYFSSGGKELLHL